MNFISSIFSETSTTLDKVIWSVFIGAVIASVMFWFNQRVIGRAVRELVKRGALSADNALTLENAGINNFFVRRALCKKDSTLRKVIYATSDKQKLKKDDFSSVGFYIPEELKIKAEVKYNAKNTTIPLIIITVIVMFLLALLCQKYLPILIDAYTGDSQKMYYERSK